MRCVLWFGICGQVVAASKKKGGKEKEKEKGAVKYVIGGSHGAASQHFMTPPAEPKAPPPQPTSTAAFPAFSSPQPQHPSSGLSHHSNINNGSSPGGQYPLSPTHGAGSGSPQRVLPGAIVAPAPQSVPANLQQQSAPSHQLGRRPSPQPQPVQQQQQQQPPPAHMQPPPPYRAQVCSSKSSSGAMGLSETTIHLLEVDWDHLGRISVVFRNRCL